MYLALSSFQKCKSTVNSGDLVFKCAASDLFSLTTSISMVCIQKCHNLGIIFVYFKKCKFKKNVAFESTKNPEATPVLFMNVSVRNKNIFLAVCFSFVVTKVVHRCDSWVVRRLKGNPINEISPIFYRIASVRCPTFSLGLVNDFVATVLWSYQ